jgi:hypothetical protein
MVLPDNASPTGLTFSEQRPKQPMTDHWKAISDIYDIGNMQPCAAAMIILDKLKWSRITAATPESNGSEKRD